MAFKQKQPTNADIKQLLVAGLKQAALAPSIIAYKPHEKQEEFHSNTAKGRLFLGGNRSGKTVGGATEAVWWLLGKHPYIETPPPPVRGRVVSVDFVNGVEKIVKPEIAKWVPPSQLRGGTWSSAYDKMLRTLHFENGSFLEFMSYDQDLDKFAGTSRHFTWFDEEPPKSIFNECKARLIDTRGSWWITMTPVEGMTWVFDDLFEQRNTDPNIHVVEVDMGENPHLSNVEIDLFLSGLDKNERAARERGTFVSMSGLIYNLFPENLLPEDFRPNPDWLHFGAMDHGLNNPTAWLWMAVDEKGNVYVYDEHYEADKVVSYHAARVLSKQAEWRIPFAYAIGDPAIKQRNGVTGTSVQLEYFDHSITIVPGNNDVIAGINRVKEYIGNPMAEKHPKLFISRRCTNLLWEFRRYRWAKWATKKMESDRNPKEEPHKKDDHAMDALRYGIASRPELDTGTFIPAKKNSMGASRALPSHGRITADWLNNPEGFSDNEDFHLGEDW